MSKFSFVFPLTMLLHGCGSWMETRSVDPAEAQASEFCENHAEKHYPPDYRLREELKQIKVVRTEPGFIECSTSSAKPSFPRSSGMNLPDTRIGTTTCHREEKKVESYDTVSTKYLWDINWSAWGSDYLACMRAKGLPSENWILPFTVANNARTAQRNLLV